MQSQINLKKTIISVNTLYTAFVCIRYNRHIYIYIYIHDNKIIVPATITVNFLNNYNAGVHVAPVSFYLLKRSMNIQDQMKQITLNGEMGTLPRIYTQS